MLIRDWKQDLLNVSRLVKRSSVLSSEPKVGALPQKPYTGNLQSSRPFGSPESDPEEHWVESRIQLRLKAKVKYLSIVGGAWGV